MSVSYLRGLTVPILSNTFPELRRQLTRHFSFGAKTIILPRFHVYVRQRKSRRQEVSRDIEKVSHDIKEVSHDIQEVSRDKPNKSHCPF